MRNIKSDEALTNAVVRLPE